MVCLDIYIGEGTTRVMFCYQTDGPVSASIQAPVVQRADTKKKKKKYLISFEKASLLPYPNRGHNKLTAKNITYFI